MRKYCKQVRPLHDKLDAKRYYVLDSRTRKTVIPGTVTKMQACAIVRLLNSKEPPC
jgi:hypothetical protein